MDALLAKLQACRREGDMEAKLVSVLTDFYHSYRLALSHSPELGEALRRFEKLIELIVHQVREPHPFSLFHRGIRHPFDYYQFGLDFIRPFVDFSRSTLSGTESLHSIQKQVERGENVVLFANHQTEPDPPIISLLMEKTHPQLACDMVFVAGDRVINDPSAAPMSLGRNLLCIYSKKHISHPPERKAQKTLHNRRTLNTVQELLNGGGYCIFVAPSGGRDRPDAEGRMEPAPFDPQSVESFWLMGQRAAHRTHFYPLALQTHHLMPPPAEVEQELGEKRDIYVSPVHLGFGEEIDMQHFPGSEGGDKHSKREKRAEYIWQQVCSTYRSFAA